jgi:hypothetical protein
MRLWSYIYLDRIADVLGKTRGRNASGFKKASGLFYDMMMIHNQVIGYNVHV